MKKITLLIIAMISFYGFSQCGTIHKSLNDRIQESDLVVEGELISSTPFRSDQLDIILTRHDIKVTKLFKSADGSAPQTVSLVSKGGVLGLEFNHVSGELNLNSNSKGVFTLKNYASNMYEAVGNAHGFISYSVLDGKAYDFHNKYETISEVYTDITQITGRSYLEIAPTSFNVMPGDVPEMVSITNMTPLSLDAGVEDVLTINGSGFGNTQGSQLIFFQNADNGGGFSLNPDDTQILLWSDTQIQVEIPSGAGNGGVALADVVNGSLVATAFSAQDLAIGFNHVNFIFPPQPGFTTTNSVSQVRLFSDNGSGGYDYNYTTDAANGFTNEPDAVATMDELFEKWRCTTGVNLNRGTDLSPSDPANTANPETAGADTINVLKFDGNDFPANSGTLAFVLTRGSGCIIGTDVFATAAEMDVVINDAINWHFRDGGASSATLGPGEFDFESVMLHELGHAQQLGHVIDPTKVMHFAIGDNTMSRDIDIADVIGGSYVNSISTIPNPCGNPSMVLAGCNFIYENTAWTPIDPSGTFNPISTIEVRNGTSSVNETLGTNDITVNSGATWDSNISTPIILLGDLTNNGSASFDFLVTQGTGTQNFTGNTSTFDLLQIDGSGTVNMNGPVDITGVLFPNTGTLNANGNITLKSDAVATAYVDEVNGTINGDVIVEHYVPSRRAFRFVSSPVTTTTTIFDNWQEGGAFVIGLGTHITGSAAGANGFDASGSGNPSMFIYDNTGTTGWNSVSSTNASGDVLNSGVPYRLFVRGDRDPALLTAVLSNNTTLRTTGTLNGAGVNGPALSNDQDGFSFVGNPYQAPIDMEEVLTTNSTNLKPSYYVWDPRLNDRGAYVTVNTVSGAVSTNSTDPTAANKFAQPMQAFFVQTDQNGAASISFNQSNKNVSEGNIDVNRSSVSGSISAQLLDQTHNVLDGFLIQFDAAFDNGVTSMDASKLTNLDENIAVENTGRLFSIEERDLPNAGDVIILNTTRYKKTQYEFEFTLSGTISPYVYLKDNFTGVLRLLENDMTTVVDFSVDPTNALTIDPNRFEIIFQNQVLSNTDNSDLINSIYPNPNSGNFNIVLNDVAPAQVLIYNLLGQQVWSQGVESTTITPISTNLSSGTYLVQITQNGARQTQKVVIK